MSNADRKLLIFDVDGTLYYLPLLRLFLFFEFTLLIVCRKTNFRDLKCFFRYRTYRESQRLSNVFLSDIHANFCQQYSLSTQYLDSIIKNFTETFILKYLFYCRRRYVIAFIRSQLNHGNVVCFLSDYPVQEKLLRLKIDAALDKCYSSMDSSINQLKPSVAGLQLLLRNNDFLKKDVFLIGDSVSRDGAIADFEHIEFIKVNRKNIRDLKSDLTRQD
jgi:FMN phosphatase YigB (HAD superfamily)